MIFSSSLVIFFLALAAANEPFRQTVPLLTKIDAIISNTDCDTYVIQVKDNSPSRVEIESFVPLANISRVHANEQKQLLLLFLSDPATGCSNSTFRVYLNQPLRAFLRFSSGRLFTEGDGVVNPGPGKLALSAGGRGDVNFRMNVAVFSADITGPKQCLLSGVVHDHASFAAAGSSMIDATNVKVKKAKIIAYENSIIKVNATEDLDIERDPNAQVIFQLPEGKKPSRYVVRDTTLTAQNKSPTMVNVDTFFEILKGYLN